MENNHTFLFFSRIWFDFICMIVKQGLIRRGNQICCALLPVFFIKQLKITECLEEAEHSEVETSGEKKMK